MIYPVSKSSFHLIDATPSKPTEDSSIKNCADRAIKWASSEDAMSRFRPGAQKINPFAQVTLKFPTGNDQESLFPIPLTRLLKLPYFKGLYEEQKVIEVNILPYCHPQAAAQLMQWMHGKLLDPKGCLTLAQLQQQFPKDFDIILEHLIHLSTTLEFDKLKKSCIEFMCDEMKNGTQEIIQHRIKESFTTGRKPYLEMIKESIRSSPHARFSIIKALLALSQCSEKEILKEYFNIALGLALKTHADFDEMMTTFELALTLFPHFDFPQSFMHYLSEAPAISDAAFKRWPNKKAMFFYVANFCLASRNLPIMSTFGEGIAAKGILQEFELLRSSFCQSTQFFPSLLEMLDQVLVLNPCNVYALAQKAEIYIKSGDQKQARAALNRALQIEPHYFRALQMSANLHKDQREFDAAISDFSLMLSRDPKNIELILEKARSYYLSGNLDAAIKDYSHCLSLESNHPYALAERGDCHRLKGSHDEAMKDYHFCISLSSSSPDARALAYAGRGSIYLHTQQFKEAIDDLSNCMKLSKNKTIQSFALVRRGICHRDQRNPNLQEALRDFTEALWLTPNDPYAWLQRAKCHFLEGNIPEGIRAINVCLQNQPNDEIKVSALIIRAKFYLQKGNLHEAKETLDECLKLSPTNFSAIALRASCLLQLGDTHVLPDLNRCLESNPEDDFALLLRGRYHLAVNRCDEALSDLNASLKLKPNNTQALILRAECHRLKNNLDDAITDANAVLTQDSKSYSAYYLKGICLQQQGKDVAARLSFNNAIKNAPNEKSAASCRKLIDSL